MEIPVVEIDGVACCLKDGVAYISVDSVIKANLFDKAFNGDNKYGGAYLKEMLTALKLPYKTNRFISEDNFALLMDKIYIVARDASEAFKKKVVYDVFPALKKLDADGDGRVQNSYYVYVEDEKLTSAQWKMKLIEQREKDKAERERTKLYLQAMRIAAKCTKANRPIVLKLLEESGICSDELREMLTS